MRKIKLFLLLIMFGIMAFGNDLPDEEWHYIVNYFMLPSLEMRMTLYDSVEYENIPCSKIVVSTKTKQFYNKIFSIDNLYTSYFNLHDYSCLYHEKVIRQPNVEQVFSVEYKNGNAYYSNDINREVRQSTLDFFSLLMYVRILSTESLNPNVVIDMEGEIFDVSFEFLKEEYIKVSDKKLLVEKIALIFKKQFSDQESVLDYTDIFFWKIAEEKGEKIIWIEKNDARRIVKARFSEGGSWLEAKLIERE